MKKIDIRNNINKYYIITGGVCILAVVILLVISIKENTKQYLTEHGMLEHTEIMTGYIVKDEAIIAKEQGKVMVPIVSEGARISKDSIIATYKGDEYKNYEETLASMDKEIFECMKDLPIMYSSEVNTIDDTIYTLIKESIGETSYNKMQEYKQKINSYINKRTGIIGELSPDGAQIRRLIKERNEYEQKAKQSNDNILAPMPGIVSYTVDGLEEALSYTKLEELNYLNIKQIIDENKKTDNTKIKVVNNYEAYIIMKSSLDNLEYIEEGYNYRIRLIEQDNYEFMAVLEKMVKVEEGIEVYFKVTNGIENVVNLREAEMEVVWDRAEGFIIPSKAVNKYLDKEAYYVTVIKYGDYKNIPVDVKLQSENFVVVNNYTNEKKEEIGIECKYELKLYDRIIVEVNK